MLAGRALSARWASRPVLGVLATATVALSLLIPAWARIDGAVEGAPLAGEGGLPGGREAGRWIDANVPEGATLMTIGPSMANLVSYYGRRRAYGLSVSPNPLNRNPSYEPLVNPDRALRDNEIQYVVWDAFSASRSPRFSRRLLRYAARYDGRMVHSELLPARGSTGLTAQRPAIVIFEVRP